MALLIVLFGTLALLLGCSSSETPAAPEPTAEQCAHELDGVCIGAPLAALCADDPCVGGLDCASIASASSSAELTGALASATSGECVAVSPGQYTGISVPAGVSLIGRGADLVAIDGVTLRAGATLRGVRVGPSGITIEGSGVHLDSVRIESSSTDGLSLVEGASVNVTRSEILRSGRYGVRAFNAESVVLEQSLVLGSKGPGVWVECSAGCDCPAPPGLTLRDVMLRDNLVVALSLVGTRAALERVEIRENPVGTNLEPAGGIAASQCSSLTAMQLRVLDNAAYGVLIDDSNAVLGDASGRGPVVSGNRIGIWCQNIGRTAQATVTIEGASLLRNEGVGIGVDRQSSVQIRASEIFETRALVLPVLIQGSPNAKEVGDGISWLGGSSLVVSGVTLGGNARMSMLINGEVGEGSQISALSLIDGDDQLGVLQQNLPAGGTQPALGPGAPGIATQVGEAYPIPNSLAVPPSI
jgi:hypothetical protein